MWITTILSLGFASLLAVTAAHADGPGQSRTPSSQYAKAIQPWQFDFGNQSDAQDALTHQGYTVEHHENPDTSYYPNPPNPTLPQWVSCVGAYAGAFFHGGHGDSQGIAVEVYPRTARGHRLAQDRVTYYRRKAPSS
jgi:hypothetical protein